MDIPYAALPAWRTRRTKRVVVMLTICLYTLLILFGITAVLVQAATSSKTNSNPGFADGNAITRTVTFSGGDFAAGARVGSVTLSVTLEKVDASCGSYLGGSVYNREMYMLLSSPVGTDIVLIESTFDDGGSGNGRTYTSNTDYNGVVTIVFDDSAATRVGGLAPESGTFRPEQALSAFDGEDPTGEWTLTIGDHNANEPHCFYEFTLTIEADQPPVADDQTFGVAENSANGTAVGTVAWSDSDAGEKVTFAEIGGTGTAVFDIDSSSGEIRVSDGTALDFEDPTKDQYTYIVELTDSGALTDTATITINVTNANDAPTDIALAPSTVDEHRPAGTVVGTLTSTDQDATDTHLYSLVSGTGDSDNALFAISGDSVETAAELNYEDQVTYTIRVQSNDQNGGTFSRSLTITLNDVNDPPTDMSLSSASVAENQPVNTAVGTFTSTDPNADTHLYTLVNGGGDDDNGSFTIVGDELRTNATFDFEAGPTTYTIRVQSDDQKGGLFAKPFTISVTDENDAATDFSIDNSSVAENAPIATAVGSFIPTDPDSGVYTYTLAVGAGDDNNGDFTIAGDVLQTAISFNYESTPTRTVRIELDDGLTQIEKAFVITIQNVNEAPTGVALSSASVVEHQPVGTAVGTLSSTDPDSGDSHTYKLVVGAGDDDNAEFQIIGNQLRTAAELDYELGLTRTVRIETRDAMGETHAEPFVITLIDGNDPPTDIALSGSQTITENLSSNVWIGNLSATDPNGDLPITYTLPAGNPDNSAFQIVGSELRSATSFDYEANNSYSITVEADDGNGGTYQEGFIITVVDANDAPTAIAVSPNSFAENQPSGSPVGTLSATDDDSGSHTFTLVPGVGDDDNGLFTIVGDELRTNATFDFESDPGSYSIRVQADDGAMGVYTQSLALTLADANDAPTDFSLDSTSFAENKPLGSEVASLSAVDEDAADFHAYTLVSGPGDTHNALFQFTDEVLETNALFDFEIDPLTYSVRIEVNDGNGGFFTKTVTLTLTDANDAPVAVPDFGGAIDEDSVLTTAAVSGVLVNDTDQDAGDTLTVSSHDLLSADGGLVDVASDGGFSYDPRGVLAIQSLAAGDSRTDSFAYIIQDSAGLTSTAVVTLTVTGVNDPPTANDDTTFTEQGSDVTIAILTNDTDPEGDTLTVNTFTQPGNGSVTDNGDGTLTYLPDPGFMGQDSFTYTASDGNGGTSSVATVTVSVGEVKIYLPLVLNDVEPAPDLVVTHVAATSDEVTVVIANQGTAVTQNGFWVDFYVDPTPVPTQEDETWFDVADEGIVWGVDVPLGPNQTLTLTYSTNPSAPNLFYSAENSSFNGTLAAGTSIYAHVDSAHLATTYGGVLESHELLGEPYNNISDEFFATD